MRPFAMLCVALVGCAGQFKPTQDPVALAESLMGCWELTAMNFQSPHLKAPTRVQLDSLVSDADATHYRMIRLTPAPAGTTDERNSWYINLGDNHVIMKLGEGSNSVWLGNGLTMDMVPEPNRDRMYGRAGSGASVRATRLTCPPTVPSNGSQ